MSTRALLRVAAALTLVLAGLALLVVTAGDVPGDGRLLVMIRSHAGDDVDPLARLVDRTTGYPAVGALTALLVLVLLHRRRTLDGAFVAVAVAGAIAGNAMLKQLVQRPRPELLAPLEDVSAYSFPSGHAAATAALSTAVVLVAAGTRWMLHVALAATFVVLVAAAAQLVLALHHPSDVLAGWLWAGAWTTALAAAFRNSRRAGPRTELS